MRAILQNPGMIIDLLVLLCWNYRHSEYTFSGVLDCSENGKIEGTASVAIHYKGAMSQYGTEVYELTWQGQLYPDGTDQGMLFPEDQLFHEKIGVWQPASNIPELNAVFSRQHRH